MEKLKEKTTIQGIRVGDIFSNSWGYEQTNVDFYRVEKVRGSNQVLLRQVELSVKNENAISDMSSNCTYNINDYKYFDGYTPFIDDNAKGIIKKVNGTDRENAYIRMPYSNAHIYKGQQLYCSWYA